MSQYKTCIEQALSHHRDECQVIDIHAIPDYAKLLSKKIDPKFGRYAKRYHDIDWTVLQFRVEKIEEDDPAYDYFPLGVRTWWRPFAADNHTRIVKDPRARCGMTFDILRDIREMPEADAKNATPGGMYVLQEYPEDPISPEPFILGSRALLETVTKDVCDSFHCGGGVNVREEWEDFRDNVAPQSDTLIQHCQLLIQATGSLFHASS